MTGKNTRNQSDTIESSDEFPAVHPGFRANQFFANLKRFNRNSAPCGAVVLLGGVCFAIYAIVIFKLGNWGHRSKSATAP